MRLPLLLPILLGRRNERNILVEVIRALVMCRMRYPPRVERYEE